MGMIIPTSQDVNSMFTHHCHCSEERQHHMDIVQVLTMEQGVPYCSPLATCDPTKTHLKQALASSPWSPPTSLTACLRPPQGLRSVLPQCLGEGRQHLISTSFQEG